MDLVTIFITYVEKLRVAKLGGAELLRKLKGYRE